MDFRTHLDLVGKHATFSASQYHWIRYTPEKMADRYSNLRAAQLGTEKHELAARLIKLGIKLPNTSQTLNAYVNDAIGHHMQVEQVLFYSYNFFGTADAIDFTNKTLRIFDLKTGTNKASEDQLNVYGALFCLEYNIKPTTIEYDFRIYQYDEVVYFDTNPEEILYIMDRIVEFDKLINQWNEEN